MGQRDSSPLDWSDFNSSRTKKSLFGVFSTEPGKAKPRCFDLCVFEPSEQGVHCRRLSTSSYVLAGMERDFESVKIGIGFPVPTLFFTDGMRLKPLPLQTESDLSMKPRRLERVSWVQIPIAYTHDPKISARGLGRVFCIKGHTIVSVEYSVEGEWAGGCLRFYDLDDRRFVTPEDLIFKYNTREFTEMIPLKTHSASSDEESQSLEKSRMVVCLTNGIYSTTTYEVVRVTLDGSQKWCLFSLMTPKVFGISIDHLKEEFVLVRFGLAVVLCSLEMPPQEEEEEVGKTIREMAPCRVLTWDDFGSMGNLERSFVSNAFFDPETRDIRIVLNNGFPVIEDDLQWLDYENFVSRISDSDSDPPHIKNESPLQFFATSLPLAGVLESDPSNALFGDRERIDMVEMGPIDRTKVSDRSRLQFASNDMHLVQSKETGDLELRRFDGIPLSVEEGELHEIPARRVALDSFFDDKTIRHIVEIDLLK